MASGYAQLIKYIEDEVKRQGGVTALAPVSFTQDTMRKLDDMASILGRMSTIGPTTTYAPGRPGMNRVRPPASTPTPLPGAQRGFARATQGIGRVVQGLPRANEAKAYTVENGQERYKTILGAMGVDADKVTQHRGQAYMQDPVGHLMRLPARTEQPTRQSVGPVTGIEPSAPAMGRVTPREERPGYAFMEDTQPGSTNPQARNQAAINEANQYITEDERQVLRVLLADGKEQQAGQYLQRLQRQEFVQRKNDELAERHRQRARQRVESVPRAAAALPGEREATVDIEALLAQLQQLNATNLPNAQKELTTVQPARDNADAKQQEEEQAQQEAWRRAGNWHSLPGLAAVGQSMLLNDIRRETYEAALDETLAALPADMTMVMEAQAPMEVRQRQWEDFIGSAERRYLIELNPYFMQNEKDTLAWLQQQGQGALAEMYVARMEEAARQRQLMARKEALDDEDKSALEKAALRLWTGLDNIGTGLLASPVYAAEVLAQQVQNFASGDSAAVQANSSGSRMMNAQRQAGEAALHGTTPAGRFVGETLMSVGNNLANYALYGGLSPAMMGVQAGAGTAYDVGQRGGSGAQQFWSGVLAGGAETLGESISLSGLENILNGNPVGARQVLTQIAAQMGTEAIEESATEAMNILSDILVMRDKSQLADYYRDYMERYPGEVNRQAMGVAGEVLGQILYSGAQGALSGGIMGGGASLVKGAQGGSANTSTRALPGVSESRLEQLAKGRGVVQDIYRPESMTMPQGVLPILPQQAMNDAALAMQGALEEARRKTGERGLGDLDAFMPSALPSARQEPAAQMQGVPSVQGALAQTNKDANEGYKTGSGQMAGEPGPLFASYSQSVAQNENNGDPHGLPNTQRIQQASQGVLPRVTNEKQYTQAIVEKLKQGVPELADMDVVAQMDGSEFRKGPKNLVEQVATYFGQLGNRVTRAGFGDVVLNQQGVRSSIAHGIGRAKAVAFAAVPDVIQQGRQIDYQAGWRGRGYDSYVFAAPVEIAGQRGYVAAVVRKKPGNNDFYLHEIVDSQGNIIKTDAGSSFKTLTPAPAMDAGGANAPAASSNESIAQSGPIGNDAGEQNVGGQRGELTPPAQTARRGREALEAQAAADAQSGQQLGALYEEKGVADAKRARVEQQYPLSEAENQYVNDLLRGIRDEMASIPVGLNAGNIRAVYAARKAAEKAASAITVHRMQRRQVMYDAVGDLFSISDAFADKRTGVAYSMETMERNIRDIVPRQQAAVAEEINAALFAPVHRHVADAVLMKEEMRGRVRELGLNRHEAVYLQIYGELQGAKQALENRRHRRSEQGELRLHDEIHHLEKAGQEYIQQFGNKIDMAKIENGVEVFREIYNELHRRINEVRMRNGYAPISYRQGYFPHFSRKGSDGLLGKLAQSLGIDTGIDAIPTSISGLTETFKPGIQWFGNAQRRTSFETEYNALQGLDRYLEAAGDIIYLTDDIQRLRTLERVLRDKYTPEAIRQRRRELDANQELTDSERQAIEDEQGREVKMSHLAHFTQEVQEYTNLLAGKKSFHDRGQERDFGRRMYQAVNAVNARVAANMVALNVSTNLTNFIPLQQAWAETSTASMARAVRDTVMGEVRNDLKVAESAFLTGRLGSNPLYQSGVQRVAEVLGKPMEWVDPWVAKVVTRARYYDNLRNGMERQAAIQEADAWAASLMAARTKGATPTYFARKNPNAKMSTRFQLEVNNQLRHLFKDIPGDARKKGLTALVLMLAKYFLGASLFNDLFEKVMGRRPALDPLGIANETIGDLTGYRLPNVVDAVGGILSGQGVDFVTEQVSFGQAGKTLGKNLLEEMPFINSNPVAAQLLSAMGIEGVEGRIPVGSAIPNLPKVGQALFGDNAEEWNRQVLSQELAKPLLYYGLPVGGGQLKKTLDGLRVLTAGGNFAYNKEGERLLKYAVENPDALQWAQGLVFGPSALPSARQWREHGYKTESARYTAGYDAARKVGVDGDVFAAWWDVQRGIDSNAAGENSIAGARAEAVMDMDLQPEQQMVLYLAADERYREQMAQAMEAGVRDEVMLYWWSVKDTFKADKNQNGNPIPGSKREKVEAAARALGLPWRQTRALLEAAGVK